MFLTSHILWDSRPVDGSPARRSRYLALIVLMAAVAAFPVAAQESDAPQFEERIEVTEVTLDIQVTDAQGNAVLGLEVDDFNVTEDGDPVEVVSATSYSTRYAAGGDRQGDSRFIILVVHTPIGAEADRPGTLRQRLQLSRDLAEWFDYGPQPSDWIAVVTYKSSIKVLQDFTQDRNELREAIEKAGMGKEPRSRIRREDDGSPFALAADLPFGKELIRESATIYDALGLLADASGRILGRKLMVLFSPGFGEYENSVALAHADKRYYDDMLARMHENNVAVYPIDTTPVEFEHPQKGTLQRLGTDTGGDFAPYVTRFGTRMEEISNANAVYYLIGYRVEHRPEDEGFRKVEVSTTRDGLKVATRNGYFYQPESDTRR